MKKENRRIGKQALACDGAVKFYGVTLDEATVETARKLGEGNLSKGLRMLARQRKES